MKRLLMAAGLSVLVALSAGAAAAVAHGSPRVPSGAKAAQLSRSQEARSLQAGATEESGEATELSEATETESQGTEGSSSEHRPDFAHKPDVTGLARAVEVLTSLQAAHPDVSGLANALEHVTANMAAHPTGQGHPTAH
jgi:hypothetical protein